MIFSMNVCVRNVVLIWRRVEWPVHLCSALISSLNIHIVWILCTVNKLFFDIAMLHLNTSVAQRPSLQPTLHRSSHPGFNPGDQYVLCAVRTFYLWPCRLLLGFLVSFLMPKIHGWEFVWLLSITASISGGRRITRPGIAYRQISGDNELGRWAGENSMGWMASSHDPRKDENTFPNATVSSLDFVLHHGFPGKKQLIVKMVHKDARRFSATSSSTNVNQCDICHNISAMNFHLSSFLLIFSFLCTALKGN